MAETPPELSDASRQRIYDAMLIRAFRADVWLIDLAKWLKVYGIAVPDASLKRQPKYWNVRVRYFVGAALRPLADRLWDTDPSQDVATLDWMRNLNSEYISTKERRERDQVKRKIHIDQKKRSILNDSWDKHKRTEQWFVTKGRR